jgi:hypothetical protein
MLDILTDLIVINRGHKFRNRQTLIASFHGHRILVAERFCGRAAHPGQRKMFARQRGDDYVEFLQSDNAIRHSSPGDVRRQIEE